MTLEHILLRDQYNDLGFIVGNRLLVLVEAQSTFTENILIRFLAYLGDTWRKYIKGNDMNIFGSRKLKVPEPELYVIIHEKKGAHPEEIQLAPAFFGKEPKDSFVNIRAKIIYDGSDGDILDQYITFCRVFDDQVRLHGRTKKAIEETIRICRDRNVLKEYLANREVAEIMGDLFDLEDARRIERNEEREEGREEGRILETVDIYRNEMELDDKTIITRLKRKFGLSEADAEKYVLSIA